MSGLYVHIPFCKSACYYCNFHFSTSHKLIKAYTSALIKEAEEKAVFYNSHLRKQFPEIKTLYFGGGTPSVLPVEETARIINSLYRLFPISHDVEFTMEANPDDISSEWLSFAKQAGVNRLSIGIQSFQNKDLRFLKRTHNAEMAKLSIIKVQDAGFLNFNIDLIYGVPTLTLLNWEKNLDEVYNSDIPHLSAYCLTVEPKTPLAVLIKKGKMKDVSDAGAVAHYKLLIKKMSEKGYSHYEISNFCRDSFFSKHNISYWQQKPYLGLGASAHSFYDNMRSWNVQNTSLYVKNINNNLSYSEGETLDLNTRFNEYIMTSLRTIWGCDTNYIEKQFGEQFSEHVKIQVSKKTISPFLHFEGSHISLNEKGKLYADRIASDMFLV